MPAISRAARRRRRAAVHDLFAQGHSKAEIARRLRHNPATVAADLAQPKPPDDATLAAMFAADARAAGVLPRKQRWTRPKPKPGEAP
jgi:transposase